MEDVAIPDEGKGGTVDRGAVDKKNQAEISFPHKLKPVLADSAMFVNKGGDILSINFLMANDFKVNQREVVAQVRMTPRNAKAFVDKLGELLVEEKK